MGGGFSAGKELPPQLLELIYATALDSSRWQEFCDAFFKHTGNGLLMFGHDISKNCGLGMIGAGFDPYQLERYEYFADKNPWMHMDLVMPVGTVGLSDQALDQRDLFKTEFYSDWLRHQDNVVGGPALMCYRSADRFVAMAAGCRAQDYDNKARDMQTLLQMLSQHLTRSIEISIALPVGRDPSPLLLDQMEHGVILVHQSGRSGFINRAAKAALRSSNVLQLNRDDNIRSSDTHLELFLISAIAAITSCDFHKLPSPRRVALSDTECMMIHPHIFPDIAHYQFPGSVWSDPIAGALLLAGPTGFSTQRSIVELAMSIGATRAEGRLAEALLHGKTLNEYADERGVSQHTVRNQMRALLAKSGTRNQVDFVRHMVRMTSPFRQWED